MRIKTRKQYLGLTLYIERAKDRFTKRNNTLFVSLIGNKRLSLHIETEDT